MAHPDGKHIFGTVKVGTKGQIVIPKEARDIFNIQPGDSLLMLGDEKQGIALVKQELFFEFADAILNSKSIKETDKE
ncbi:AbrB/MazE/SpoVT family DNA-binding domain-containing protein [Sporosarcina sp. FSL K6-2383]|uniref:AbrB/MazE/SpoVT family DNA-binding domain-containing protein n=1 Tax=Sporosarcina sp. FSL K6-2383 TaxID=2921556 RepID=UPI00315B1460